jgi:predicted DNA-binding protein (MmcQ/YjbR family)
MSSSRNQIVSRLWRFMLALPEAYEDHPWGERVAKVAKKVFVFGHVPNDTGDVFFTLKLPDSGPDMLHERFASPTGYGLAKSGWVTLHFGPKETIPAEKIQSWIGESYRAVAPKKLVAALDGKEAPRKPRKAR